jgi:DNA-binding XRE family transcriptional regulator
MKKSMKFRAYADDHLNRFKKGDPLESYETRAKYYAECGIMLSKDKDMVSDTIIGHTFLGMTVGLYKGTFVPKADPEKILGGLTFPPKGFELDVDFSRTVAYMMLATFSDRKLFDEIREHAIQLQNQGAKFVSINDTDVYTIELSQLKYLPTYEDCVKFWTAFEEAGSGSPCFDGLIKELLWNNISTLCELLPRI